ncbi:MAG: FAD-dependent thymidylate synthase [Patescibacteria group bacterium]
MQYEDLKHVRRSLGGSGQVVVIDNGALITAEADAMLQALHSRSIGGIDAHLVRLAQKGAQQFMDTYYVGYGDKSIGDCGTATVFIEGVSMLAAKAIQDSQLYNGQESSTRYIDFSKQPFANPSNSNLGQDLLWKLREFHLKGLERMKEVLAERHPKQADEDEKVWKKAINARAFDIMRSFLPAGAATNLSWHAELRQLADHLLRLRNHPLEEVRNIALVAREALDEMYPSSFKQKLYPATEEYTRNWMEKSYYFDAPDVDEVTLEWDGTDKELLKSYVTLLPGRGIKTEPPKYLGECGTLRFSFLLDFGSFRDLQRHRSLIQRMPLLTDAHGFNEWYLEQMPHDLALEAAAFLGAYENGIAKLSLSPALKQYMIPMGYKVACRITGDIPALIWLVELRSKLDVHPTLRIVAQKIGVELVENFGMYGLTLHIDKSSDRFNYKRGTQDIVEKQSSLLK